LVADFGHIVIQPILYINYLCETKLFGQLQWS